MMSAELVVFFSGEADMGRSELGKPADLGEMNAGEGEPIVGQVSSELGVWHSGMTNALEPLFS